LDPRIKGVWIQKQHPTGDAKLVEVQKAIHKLYPSIALVQDPPNDNTNSTNNAALSFFDSLLIEINTDKTSTSNVDLYFNTPIINWRHGKDKDDPNWVLNW